MKNRRTIVMAFLLCACLIVGMGYAAVTTDLHMHGDANISADAASTDFDADIQYGVVSDVVNCAAVVGTQNATSGDLSLTNDLVTVTLTNTGSNNDTTTMCTAGDTASFKVTVVNNGTAAATLKFDAKYDSTYFTVVITPDSTTVPAATEAGAGTVTLNVLITLKATPTDGITNGAFDITFTATAQ